MCHSESESIGVCESETQTMRSASVHQWGRGDFLSILSYDWSHPQHTIGFEPMGRVGVHVAWFPGPLKEVLLHHRGVISGQTLFLIARSRFSMACAEVLVKPQTFCSHLVSELGARRHWVLKLLLLQQTDTERHEPVCIFFFLKRMSSFNLCLPFTNNS